MWRRALPVVAGLLASSVDGAVLQREAQARSDMKALEPLTVHPPNEGHAPNEGHGEDEHEASHGDGHGHGGHDDHSGHGHDEHAADSHGHGGHDEHAADSHGHGGHHEHAADSHGHGDHGHGGHDDEAVKSGHGHGGHGDAGHGGHGEAGHGGHGHGHGEDAHSVAIGMLATVTVIPVVISMALEDGRVHELTMKMLDTFISIFLAVLWFNTFRQALETFEVASFFPYARELFAMVQVVSLYAIANAVAYVWRNNNMRLTTFCGCGAHFIAFAGIGWGAEGQMAAANAFSDSYGTLAVFGFVIFIAAFLFVMFLVNTYLWKGKSDHHEMKEAIEELELDVVGLVISFVITQGIRHALTGHYPPMHFLLQMVGTSEPVKLEAWQRYFMLFWSLFLVGVAALVLPKLNELAEHSSRHHESMHRGVHVLKVILIMLVAWGFLLWGQWEFQEHLFPGHNLFGQMIFAVTATLVCMIVLVLVAKFGNPTTMAQVETYNITTTGISLVAAWSWEHCFNQAFDIIGNEYQVGFKGLVPKMFLSIVVPLAILPMYLSHVRPRVLELNEEHEKTKGHGHGGHRASEEEHAAEAHA